MKTYQKYILGSLVMALVLLTFSCHNEDWDATYDYPQFLVISGSELVSTDFTENYYTHYQGKGVTYEWSLSPALGTVTEGQGTDRVKITFGDEAGKLTITVKSSKGNVATKNVEIR